MQKFTLAETNENRRKNKLNVKYPDIYDSRFSSGMIFPKVYPSFNISMNQSIFTIGSCFARNIEKELSQYNVPTLRYDPPKGDPLAKRGNTVFNEYNPGTIAQRIDQAFNGEADEIGIIAEGDGYSDFLITGSSPCSEDIVRTRRSLMNAVYKDLPESDLLVITLGMTEAWFDLESGIYLNRAPAPEAFRDAEGLGSRFEFRILGVDDCLRILSPSLEMAAASGLNNILLTVSPVPLQRSFGSDDAAIANSISKATLRCVADEISKNIKGVDYFPSYEMVTLYAGNPYIEDNVHVKPEIVARITSYMVQEYEAV